MRLRMIFVCRPSKSTLLSRINAKDQNRNVNVRSATLFQVPNELLKVGNTAGHLKCERFSGDNLNACINESKIMKD